ncbi:MAG: hypothetical protein MJ198_07995 [Bacteroidales bacterium]|nr:hypothetical protein [Bacteroidales bacterium]
MDNRLSRLSIYLFCVVFFSACVKDNFELKEKFSDQIEWNPSLALPIATADLTLSNIAKERKDTLEYVSESDLGYGDLVEDEVVQFKYVIDTARVIDVMHLPLFDPYDTTLMLRPVTISNVSFPIGYVTIGDLLKDNFSSSDYSEYVAAAKANPLSVSVGEKNAVKEHYYPIGAIPDTLKRWVSDNFGTEINVKDVFEYIMLKSGKVTLSCTNSSGLNFYCDVVISSKDNAGKMVEFGSFDYSGFPSWISQGGPQKKSIDIDSAYLHSEFYYSFRNLRIAQTHEVAIPSFDQGLLLNIEMKDLVAYEGKAYVPEQTLCLDTITYMTMRDEDMDRKLFRVLVESGKFDYKITSTIGIATEFVVEFPSVDSLGKTPLRKSCLMTNEKPTYKNSWSLNGNNFDLTTNPEIGYNSVPVKLGYKVHTTGGMLYFGPKQNIKIEITNPDSVVFAYVEGDLGRFEQDLFSDKLEFDLREYVSDFLSGDIVFYDPKIRINYANPIGIGGDLELNMVGHDGKGNSVDIFQGYSNKWRIVRPECSDVEKGVNVSSSQLISNKTSQIVDFMKMLPTTIDYSGKLYVNYDIPEGEPIFNCISNKGTAKLGVEIELPLKMSAKNLILQQDVNLNMSDLGDLSSIERMRLYINTEHQLPLNATLKLSLFDTTQVEGKQDLGTLDMIVLESAPTTNGKVSRTDKKVTEEEVVLEKGNPVMDNLLQANKLRIEVFLETDKNGNEPVVFYSYYGLKFNLAADCKFIYTSR